MNSKILTLLGFATKAGKLSFGMEAVKTAVKKDYAKLIVVACDVSDKSKKEIAFFTSNKDINTLILQETNIVQLSAAVGRKCGIISVNDQNFAETIFKGGNA